MLKVVTTKSNLARRPKTTMLTPTQQESASRMAAISGAWRGLTNDQMTAWNALGKVWSPGKKATATGFACFQSLNNTVMLSGNPALVADAPQVAEAVPQLPQFTIVGQHHVSPTGPFTLALDSSLFNNLILMSATPALSPGTTRIRPKDLRSVGVIQGFNQGATDLANHYLSRFGAPRVGTKIGLQFTPITPAGFRGVSRSVLVSITAAPADGKLAIG